MKKQWYDYIPHPIIMLFGMLLTAVLMSYILPAGAFDRTVIDGRSTVVAGSFHNIDQTPLSLMEMFVCIPMGFKIAIDIIFIVLASGIMFGFMEQSGAIENAVGTLVKKMGIEKKYLIVIIMTFVFGSLGVFVGYENNIAMIPIACLLSLALGGDLILAAGIAVGGVTVGFGLSPFNAYTIGTGHKIAELPLFSGAFYRSTLCFMALGVLAWYNVKYFKRILNDSDTSLSKGIETKGFNLSKPIQDYFISGKDRIVLISFIISILIILYGVFEHHWFINQISAIFCMLAIFIGIVNRTSGRLFGDTLLSSVSVVAPGAFMVGFATSIKVALDLGNISDTIAYQLSNMLVGLPLGLAAIGMAVVQSIMNFMIPSGSGQALATLPVLIPVGEVIGITRQTTVLAFQVGDGVSNLINPSLGGIVAMLSMCRIPFDRWLRFIFPYFCMIFIVALIYVGASVLFHYGPF